MTMRWSAQAIQAREQAREEERRRLARELHDELGHALFGLRMHLVWLQQRIANGNGNGNGDHGSTADIENRLPAMLELIERSARTVDDIVTDLRPPALDQLGLMAALEWQAESFARRSGLRCQFVGSGAVEDLDAGRATAVFRMFQEILTNVERHARASRVSVHVKRIGDRLTLRVRDNGRGLSPECLATPGSYGLLGMRERALLLGGELSVESGRRGGTTVIASIPLANRRARSRPNEQKAPR
jgi:two-component system sensor histidine kinase UhpB